jgi:hypothetical protein
MYRDTIPNDEIYKIQEILELIDEAVTRIPEKFHVSRWNQFKK